MAEIDMPGDEHSGPESVAYCQRHAQAVIASSALAASIHHQEQTEHEPPF